MSAKTFAKSTSQSLRGIMQLGIVCSHLSYTTAEPWLLFYLSNKIGTSIISMFFFISGYGLMTSLPKSSGNIRSIALRLWELVRPMLIISLLFLLYQCFAYEYNSEWLERLVRNGITPLPNSWFVYVLLWLYLIFWFIFNYLKCNRAIGLFLLLCLSLVQIGWAIYLGYERAWWVTTLAFFSGCLYAQYEEQIYDAVNHWWALFLIIMGTAICVVSRVEYLLLLPYIAIPIVIIILINRIGYSQWIEEQIYPPHKSFQNKSRRILDYLSKISYELYLVHGAVIIILRGHFIHIENDYLYGLLVMICSILLASIIRKILSIKLLRRI